MRGWQRRTRRSARRIGTSSEAHSSLMRPKQVSVAHNSCALNGGLYIPARTSSGAIRGKLSPLLLLRHLSAVLAAVTVSSLALAAVASAETPTASPTGTSTATATATKTATPSPIADAAALRDQLLAAARSATFVASDSFHAYGVFTAWTAAFPEIDISGSSVAAGAHNISAYNNLLESKQAESASNPKVVAFAVKDAAGHCEAGLVTGSPSFTDFKPVTLPATAKCIATEVVDLARAAKTPAATTSASATVPVASTTAPKPPTTGSGIDGQGGNGLGWIAAGIAATMAAGAGTVVAARRRQ